MQIKISRVFNVRADEFLRGDLTGQTFCDMVCNIEFDEIYQFAADMGGKQVIYLQESMMQM